MWKKLLTGVIFTVTGLVLPLAGCGLQQQKSAPPQTAPAERSTSNQPTAGNQVPTSAQLPTAGPPVSPQRYIFPVQGCRVSYGPTHHDYPATDIFTDRGCAFVAATDGQVDEVSLVDHWKPQTDRGEDRGGRSVSILGTDGVRYYGSHLDSIASGIIPGKLVHAGELLGRADNTGDARTTPTHVHFGISWPTRPGIWWVRRGEVSPWPYLNSWQSEDSLSPMAAVASAHRKFGDEPLCRVEC
jgi:murein DD-endopeptidase MepM/ murein hydrolase activator NlpD